CSARMLNTLNTCMNWGNIINNDALCEDAAVEAAKLLDSTTFLSALDDESLDSMQQAPNENGYFDRSGERAAGGAEPSAKRARLDECVLFDLDESSRTQDELEKEYFELQPATVASTSQALVPPPSDDLFYGMDYMPSTSTASTAHPDLHSDQPQPPREEDQWVDFYYELDDPHEDLIEKVKAQSAATDEQIARTDAEFTAALIEKATIDQMLASAQQTRKRRYKEVGKKDTVVFVCFVCSRGFLTTDEMREHVQDAHLKAGAERDFKCRYCRRSFAKRQKLNQHEQKHEQPHANYACDKCPAFYNTKDSLERHYSDKHGCRMDGSMIEEKNLACDTCGKAFGVEKELQYHVYYCARKDEIAEIRAAKRAKDRLSAAGASPSVSPADRHSKIAKDKSCPVCGLVTASMQSRNRHIQRIHPERYPACLDEVHVFVPTPEHLAARPFSCATCHMVFSSRAALSTHERRVHGANPTKMFYCDKCGKGYPLASELSKHEKRNEGQRVCRGRGRGDCPSGSSSTASGLSSRATSVTPSLSQHTSPGIAPIWRGVPSNAPISMSDEPTPRAARSGPKSGKARNGMRAPKKEEEDDEEEMESEQTISSATAADDVIDEADAGTSLDEEIAADEARQKEQQQYESLDDFVF
ncbi:hypothetical protein PRIPAC_84978, partial [Pristionchus pacificus]